MDNYDIVIIGAGPAGLALAHCISHLNKRILIIDKESSIGGCHRVRRVNTHFTEHGPRVYSNTYTVFQQLLAEMGLKFDDLFVKYNFSITQIGGETIFSVLSWKELFLFAIEFIKLILNEYHGRNTLLENFLESHHFTSDSKEMLDRICKLTDGGGIDKYTLYEFLQLFNQQFFYSLYQPKLPNDIGLFAHWQSFLEAKGVKFMLNTNIKSVHLQGQQIHSINVITNTNETTILLADKFVFAVPPKSLNTIVKTNQIPHDWGDLDNYAKETGYIDYISITFHWNTNLNLPKIYGFPRSSWGIAFIVLTDYMSFDQTNSKTVISVAATINDKVSKNINKTLDECNKQELIDEIFLQLREAYPLLPNPTLSLLSPGIEYNVSLRKWVSKDTAYIIASNKGYLPFQNNVVRNMYNLGTHNGKSMYTFTSMESAVSNSVVLSKQLYPELNNGKYITLSRRTTVTDVMRILLVVLLLYFIYIGNNKNNKNAGRTSYKRA
jgi:uncharacterized protein with NAD-binding domain and iron-sulfur cluster